MQTREVVLKARELGKCIPAFNCPYAPMIKSICEAIKDENSVGMIQIARVEWEKLGAQSLEGVAEEYNKYKSEGHTLLHLDHIPAVDEDLNRVDFMDFINRALNVGYESVMVDGSRLPLDENIEVTAEAVAAAHAVGVPVEAELGAVMGHESGEIPPYEEIFAKKMGFTKLDEAKKFAEESGCDWLSVACGNIHGRIAEAVRNQKKPEAKLDVAHIADLYKAAGIPLVLHGGSSIQHDCVIDAIKCGIAKVNVATEVRQAYEFALQEKPGDIEFAQQRVYEVTRNYLKNYLFNTDLADLIK